MKRPWVYMSSPSRSPPPTSLSTRSLQVFPEHQVRALVSCIQPGLVICFTLDSIHVSILFSWNIPPSPSPQSLNDCSINLCLFFFSVANIFWNPDLRCVYLSLPHRCFVSLHFWGICKASDKSELTPICQWDSLHASLVLKCVSFYIFWIQTLIGHDNANIFSISYIISHFIDGSPWQSFQF